MERERPGVNDGVHGYKMTTNSIDIDFSRAEMDFLQREAKIILAKNNFWDYCKVRSPEYYKEEYPHLKALCNILQTLYEGRVIKLTEDSEWVIVDILPDQNIDYIVCKKIMINIPPQHGKSRSLFNFSQWILGKNEEERIIACSYNDDTAADFSKYTRDGITEKKNTVDQIVYSDIFGTRIKHGTASYKKWALEGQHFSYLGAGTGGSVTSKGGTVLIIDDLVKGAIEANNDNYLEAKWKWYIGTFLSRVSAEGGEPLEIIVMTRWSTKDICGRLLADKKYAKDWYLLSMEVYDSKTDKMLCPQFLSKKRYSYLKDTMDEAIFLANYHGQPPDIMGRLYKKGFKTYKNLPKNPDNIINYTDTADEGDDFLASVVVWVKGGYGYVTDLLYTQDAMEETEPNTAELLNRNGVLYSLIESNNGGRGFARNVIKLLGASGLNNTKIDIDWFHQSQNKKARIITMATWLMNYLIFPEGWQDMFPEIYKHLSEYQRAGKNEHDDIEDCLTGIGEMISNEVIIEAGELI